MTLILRINRGSRTLYIDYRSYVITANSEGTDNFVGTLSRKDADLLRTWWQQLYGKNSVESWTTINATGSPSTWGNDVPQLRINIGGDYGKIEMIKLGGNYNTIYQVIQF